MSGLDAGQTGRPLDELRCHPIFIVLFEALMFKHILIPTDGSPLSERAVLKGIELAAEQGARVTGIHVSPQFHILTYRPDMLEDTRNAYAQDSEAHAKHYLDFVSKTAAESNVPCETVREISDEPFQAIIDAARARRCDLIVMASHGRRGISGFLLGSETHRVLTHSGIPVLVWR
jgi:nucleotide-binding universal stress UspA family protein